MQEVDFARRFGGIARLYGADSLTRLRQGHVCVVGIGGVGSWVAEALARSAIGRITLIDLDNVVESNVNRQIHALGDEFGKAKVTAMAQRIHAINPYCQVWAIEDFVTPHNLDGLLDGGYDIVIDAIDNARVKTAMIAWCLRRGIRIVISGSAGGRTDPTHVQIADLAHTIQDPLLARVRAQLRREHGFSRDPRRKIGAACVFSTEPLRQPHPSEGCNVDAKRMHPAGLNCAGYGSVMTVTASFAMLLAAHALDVLTA